MCGIVGVIQCGQHHKCSPRDTVIAMNQRLVHRGPDDAGMYVHRGVGLAMRRLSIIDLAGGHQPISNEDGTVWVIHNGEIYNYLDLRQKLIAQGHVFRTNSDTETIVHLYEEYGDACLTHLNGMFAFALYDEKSNRLLLARDRYGIKPLFYAQTPSRFLFASELQVLIGQEDIDWRIDYEALNLYFALYYLPAPYTMYRGVRRLPPGHYLVWENGQVCVKEYWDFKFNPDPSLTEIDCRQEIVRLLRQAVRRQLMSEVPLGVFLSGGLDSASITLFAGEALGEKIKTFTIGFEERSYSEIPEAHLISETLGTDHSEYVMKAKDIVTHLPDLITDLAEPVGDWTIVSNYLVSRLARRRVTVALTGAGGDELFAGYPTITAYRLGTFYRRLPGIVRRRLLRPMVEALPTSEQRLSFSFKAKAFVRGTDGTPEHSHFAYKEIFSPEARRQLYSQELQRLTQEYDPFIVFCRYLPQLADVDPINRLLYLDCRIFNSSNTLPIADFASMRVSLEARVPFLDNDLVDFACTIPPDLKHRGMTTKYIFRKALADVLPSRILRMKKKGFTIPWTGWIKRELRPFVLDILSPEAIKRDGLLNYNYIRALLEDHFSGRQDNARQIACLVSYFLWRGAETIP